MQHNDGGRGILIVGPRASETSEMESTLENLGYEVVGIAPSLGEAMRIAALADPGVVLIDAALTEGDGGKDPSWSAFLRGRIPVLLTLRDDDHERLRRIRATHPGGYLLLPFVEREVRMGISAFLDEWGSHAAPGRIGENLFDLSIDLLCCLGFDGYFARLNPAWERVLGFTREELMSRPFIEFVHPDDRDRTLSQNRDVRGGEAAQLFENRYLCKDGSYRWLMWNAAPDSTRHAIYAVARDVTELKRAGQALERLSTTDELTGVCNRRGFAALAERKLEAAAIGSDGVVMLYIDLDRFKEANDMYGHAEGDRVLVDVARLLQGSCRGGDVVARIGGDEFVVLALDEHGMGERIISERILQSLDELNAARRHPYKVGITIGAIRISPDDTADLNALLVRADRQMYRTKRSKRLQRAGIPPRKDDDGDSAPKLFLNTG